MNHVICDSCKQVVADAKREINYFTFQDKALCKVCNYKWDLDVREAMEKKKGYTLQGYHETMRSLMAKRTS